MQVTREEIKETATALERCLKIAIPAEPIQEKVAVWLKKKSSSARLPGFRPGKIPTKMLEQEFGVQAHKEVISDVISEALYKALEQEKLVPAGFPEVEIITGTPGAPLEFRAKFEVYPEIKLADLEGMTVEKRVATVTDADVERVLEDLRKQHIQWKKTDRSAQKGDRLTIDFDGSVEGQPLERGSAEDFPLILGEANMIPGFEDGLIGMAVGEERTLHLKFPDEYHAKDIAGKPVEFKIKAKEIAESCLPPLDEQFALLMGVKEGGMEKLHQEVRRTMVNELDSRLEMELKQSVLDKLLERNPLEVPKALVERETQAMQEDFMKRMGGKQPVSAKKENYAHLFTDQAKRRITISLLLADLLHDEKKTLDPQRVEQRIQRIANAYDNPDEVMQLYRNDKKRLADIEARVIEEQVIEKLLAPVTIVEKSATYYEVVKNEHT